MALEVSQFCERAKMGESVQDDSPAMILQKAFSSSGKGIYRWSLELLEVCPSTKSSMQVHNTAHTIHSPKQRRQPTNPEVFPLTVCETDIQATDSSPCPASKNTYAGL